MVLISGLTGYGPPRAVPQFGNSWLLNAESEVARNHVLSRVAIEGVGVMPWRIAFARNQFERLEAFLDTFVWWVIGLGLPLLVQWPLSNAYNNSLKRKYGLTIHSPLATSFEKLQSINLKQTSHRLALASEWGLKQVDKVPKVAQAIIVGKLLMVFVDLGFMSVKNQLYYWGRNKMTAKLSDKKGFVGVFDSATEEQRNANAAAMEKSEKSRKRWSLINGLTYPLTLPLLIGGILKMSGQSGKGLKKLLPAFDYHKTIYLSKWVVFWNCLFGWNLIGLLSVRDKFELQEHLTRCALLDFFFFVGDDIFSGIAGKVFQKHHKKALKNIPLYKKGPLGIPIGRRLDDILEQAQKTREPKLIQLAEKLGRWNFRIGILTTSLFLGIGMTLANNYFTKRRVLKEQQKLYQKKQPLSPQDLVLQKQHQNRYQQLVFHYQQKLQTAPNFA